MRSGAGSPTWPPYSRDEPELAKGALLELADNAVTAEHFAQVDEAAADDLGLAWRVATTRAARGEYDEDAVERLLERDPDPDAPFNALAVRTARPLPEAKEEAWHALYVEQSVPSGLSTYWMVQAFWQPQQRDVLLPFTWRYLEEVPKLAGGLMLKIGGLIRGMFPEVGDQAFSTRRWRWPSRRYDPTVRSACSPAATPWSGGCAPAASATELAAAQVRKPDASRTQGAPSYITPVPRTAGPDTRRHR